MSVELCESNVFGLLMPGVRVRSICKYLLVPSDVIK